MKVGPVLLGAILQFASFVDVTINFRAIAHMQYVAAGITAAIASILGAVTIYIVGDREDKDKSLGFVVGMTIGGAIADMFGIWLTRAWGQ